MREVEDYINQEINEYCALPTRALERDPQSEGLHRPSLKSPQIRASARAASGRMPPGFRIGFIDTGIAKLEKLKSGEAL